MNAAPTVATSNAPTHDKPFRVRDQRRRGFFTIDNEIYDVYARFIGIIAYAVYTALCRHADHEAKCYPSLNTLAEKLRISKPTVIKALDTLIAYGLIAKEHRFNDKGEHISNLYLLLDVKNRAIPAADEGHDPETRPASDEAVVVVQAVDQGGQAALPGGSQAALLPQGEGSQRGLPKQNPPSSLNKTQHRNKTHQNHHTQRTAPKNNTPPALNTGGGCGGDVDIPSWLIEQFTELAGQEPTLYDQQKLQNLSDYPKEIVEQALDAARAQLENPDKDPIHHLAAWLVATAGRMQKRQTEQGSAGHRQYQRRRTDKVENRYAEVEELMAFQMGLSGMAATEETATTEAEESETEAPEVHLFGGIGNPPQALPLVAQATEETLGSQQTWLSPAATISVTEQTIWGEVLNTLKVQLPSATYDTWVADTRLLSVENGVAIIAVEHEYARAWFEARLTGVIGRELGYLCKAPVEPQFVVLERPVSRHVA